MRGFVVLLGALAMSACASAPKVWTRLDGQMITGNPALEQQATVDREICLGEAQKANLSAGTNYVPGLIPQMAENTRRDGAIADVGKGCMATRGYLQVQLDQAEQTRQRLASTYEARASVASGSQR